MIDWLKDNAGYFAVGSVGIICAAILVAAIWLEIKHPCVRYDPQEHLEYMQDMGNGILLPVYGHACLERK